jgi:hypothetical protein
VSTPSAEQGRLGHSGRPGNGPLKRLRAVVLGYATFAVPSSGLLRRGRLSLGGEVTVTGARRRPLLEGGECEVSGARRRPLNVDAIGALGNCPSSATWGGGPTGLAVALWLTRLPSRAPRRGRSSCKPARSSLSLLWNSRRNIPPSSDFLSVRRLIGRFSSCAPRPIEASPTDPF